MCFVDWLSKRVNDDTAIGDLARDMAEDSRLKPTGGYRAWRAWLEDADACDSALMTLARAWRQFHKSRRALYST